MTTPVCVRFAYDCDAPPPLTRVTTPGPLDANAALLVICTEAICAATYPAWLPSSSCSPLNVVFCEMRLTSSNSCETSVCRFALSLVLLMSDAASTARLRIRCRMPVVAWSAPSATVAALLAFWTFCTAWSKPLTCACSDSAIARPDGSSAAVVILNPLDKRAVDVASAAWFWVRFSSAVLADKLLTRLKPLVAISPPWSPVGLTSVSGRHHGEPESSAPRLSTHVTPELR